MQFRTVCVAGTFDGIHRGHQAVLSAAFSHGEKVMIGLTSDSFKKTGTRAPFVVRKKALENWLVPYAGRYEIFPLEDPIGPAVTANFDALIVTSQNKHIGEQINARRLHPLALIEVDLVPAEDKKPVSATRIKNGEIDQEGKLVMPDNMRNELSQPLGPIISRARPGLASLNIISKYVITVGDMTTKTFVDKDITPTLTIIDNKVNRKPYYGLENWKKGKKIHKVTSGPGYISQEAIDAINGNHQIIEVDGEEDLLVLPAILAAPLGAYLYYGQPNVGIVQVLVSAKQKKIAKEKLARFLK